MRCPKELRSMGSNDNPVTETLPIPGINSFVARARQVCRATSNYACQERLSLRAKRHNFGIQRLKRRVYLMLFWHCIIRTLKTQDRPWVIKVKFHVFTCYKNMKSALSSLYFGSHLRTDQLNFSLYVKRSLA